MLLFKDENDGVTMGISATVGQTIANANVAGHALITVWFMPITAPATATPLFELLGSGGSTVMDFRYEGSFHQARAFGSTGSVGSYPGSTPAWEAKKWNFVTLYVGG